MQYTTVALSLFAAAVAAQDVSSLVGQIPSCATTCFTSGASQIGCGATDYTCQCGKVDELTSAVAPCLLQACNADDIGTTQKVAAEICVKVAAGGASSGVSSGVASATSAAASNAASVSSAVSSAVSSKSSEISSAISSKSSAISSSLASMTGTASSAAASATSSKAAAVGRTEAGLGFMGAAALAALAL